MTVYVNNKPFALTAVVNVEEILRKADINDHKGIALAVNNSVVPKSKWNEFELLGPIRKKQETRNTNALDQSYSDRSHRQGGVFVCVCLCLNSKRTSIILFLELASSSNL